MHLRQWLTTVGLITLAISMGLFLGACAGPDEDLSVSPRSGPEATRSSDDPLAEDKDPTESRTLVFLDDDGIEGILSREPFRPLVTAQPSGGVSVDVHVPTVSSPGNIPYIEPGPPSAGPGSPSIGPRPGEGGSTDPGSSLGETSSCNLAVMGIVRNGDGFRILVRHNPTGETQWATAGETVFGYNINLITLKGALVEKDSRYYVLPIGENIRRDEGQTGTDPGEGEGGEKPGEGREGEGGEEAASSAGGDARFVGTWSGSIGDGTMKISLTFNADHTGRSEVMGRSDNFTWSVAGNTINVSGGMGGEQGLSFRFEGDSTMVLSGGEMPFEMRFTKQ